MNYLCAVYGRSMLAPVQTLHTDSNKVKSNKSTKPNRLGLPIGFTDWVYRLSFTDCPGIPNPMHISQILQ